MTWIPSSARLALFAALASHASSAAAAQGVATHEEIQPVTAAIDKEAHPQALCRLRSTWRSGSAQRSLRAADVRDAEPAYER